MKKVAIIEDRREIADSIGRAVARDKGLKLTGVYYSAEDALSVIAADRPDLILMDIGLPKMDGIECLVKAKDILPACSVLMFTVFDTEDKLFNALRFGADGYILKKEGIIVLKEIADGKSNREIADALALTEGTIKQHVHAIYRTIQVANRVEAVNLYLRR